jgi:hypothetical protein
MAGAQTFRGAINGSVTDPSGAVVPRANVVATEKATGIKHATTTTDDGLFAILDIPLGFYKVTVSASGFPTYSADVEVSAGIVYTLPVKLSLGSQSTTVEVSAAALTLDTTTPTQNMTITSDVVQQIPLNGRDFTQLVGVTPGYAGYQAGGFGSLNGTRPNQINWQIDGVDNNDFWHNVPAVNQGGVSGIAGIVLPIDSIEEYSTQTQSGPEVGRSAGGTVNLVTKGGGNTLHGSVYYYNRNEFDSAASPFFVPTLSNPRPPKLRNENYGFSASGPIIKEKWFYFVSYEKQQYIIGLSGLATEPSTAWITLATHLLSNTDPTTGAANAFGTYAPVTPSGVSANLLGTPAGINSKGFWPASLIGGLPATLNNFFSPIASTGYSYNGVGRMDYNISDKHHIYARFFGGQGNQIAPLGGSAALGTASSNLKDYFEVAPLHVFNESVVYNWGVSPRLSNQVLVGFNYFNQIFHDFNNSFNTAALGLNLSPNATIKGKPIPGASEVAISGFEQVGLTPPEGRSDITGHVTDIVSYTRGKHQLRFGGEFRQSRLNEFYHRRGLGFFKFDGSQGPWSGATGCAPLPPATPPPACAALASPSVTEALADFLAGDVVKSQIAVGNPERSVTVNAYNFYGQDTWQLTTKLTLDFGLRYEYFGPLHSSKKDTANFIPGRGLVIQGAGLDSLFPPDRNNFAPRVGFAWEPTARTDFVVRGGIGVFYDQINMNPFLDFRPPIPGAQGIQGNPIGPAAVSTYSVPLCGTLASGGYQWDAVQAATCPAGYTNAGAINPTSSVFAGVITCADPLCVTTSPAVTPVPAFNLFSINRNFRTPYFFNYNLQVEKGFGRFSVLQVGYVGSEGRKLNNVINLNQNGVFPQFGSILQLNSIGTSNYNSLQATFSLRTWHGLSGQLGYTWSHSLDEISEYRAVIQDDAFNRKLDYGNSDYDTRQLFTAAGRYAIPNAPWANAWSKWFVNDWELSSIWNFHSGQPSDEFLLGLDQIGDPFHAVSHRFQPAIGGTQWWNPAAFAVPAPGSATCPLTGTGFCGTLQRNRFRGPGYGTVDLSIIKNIPIRERFKVQLRAELYNLFNRVNLSQGIGALGSSCGAPIQSSPSLPPTLANRTCTTSAGFGLASDTAGDFFGAPGIGPGEAFNTQLVVKIIF